VFAVGVYIVAFADYDADNSYLPTPLVRAFHFITATRQLKSLFGFLLGWTLFTYRQPLFLFLSRLSRRQAPLKDIKENINAAAPATAIILAEEIKAAEGDNTAERGNPAEKAESGSDLRDSSDSDNEAPRGRPHVWLSSGVVIAAVGAAVFIAIAAMQPEIFSRLQSLKFGKVIEANFAAAVEHSVRVSRPRSAAA
jgi:hypothetical protein